MATSFTRNLKLRIDSNLTANAKYNLERIDLIGANFLSTTSDDLIVRARGNMTFEPESADVDGSGEGGDLNFGTPDHNLDNLNFYVDSVNFSDSIGFLDTATGGNKYLRLRYKSDINGSVDTTADRLLSIDLDGSDRNIALGGNVSLAGALTTSGGALTLTLSGATSLTLPTSGTVATLAGVETLTNKILGTVNTADLAVIVQDTNFAIYDSAGSLRFIRFDSAMPANNTSVRLSVSQNITSGIQNPLVIVDTTTVQSLAQKTLTAPAITGIATLSGGSFRSSDGSPVIIGPNADAITSLLADDPLFGVAMDDDTNDLGPFSIMYAGNGGSGPELDFSSSRGTYASPDYLQASDNVMAQWMSAWSGAGTDIAGVFRLRAEENHSATALGTRYQFDTMTVGQNTPSQRLERLRLSSEGIRFSNAHLVIANQATNTPGELRFREGNTSGTNYTGFKAPASIASDHVYTLPDAPPLSSGYVLSSTTGGVLSWTATGAGSGDVLGFVGTWLNVDGAGPFLITHGLNSTNPDVTIIDDDTDEVIFIDSIEVTSSNAITVEASEAPANSWRVIIQAKP